MFQGQQRVTSPSGTWGSRANSLGALAVLSVCKMGGLSVLERAEPHGLSRAVSQGRGGGVGALLLSAKLTEQPLWHW